MLLIEGSHIVFEPREKRILDIEHIQIYEGDRIGLIGQNGSGKTSLVRIIKGEIIPDQGVIVRRGGIGYIPQLEEGHHLKKEMMEDLSGGEQTKLKITLALQERNHLLILDEPTSHMDKEGILFLRKTLDKLVSTMILISHDRYLIDSLCNKIWELREGKIKEYIGNYSQYILEKEKEDINYQRQYENYTKTRKSLEKAKEEKIKQSKKLEKPNAKLSPSDKRSKPLASGTRSIEKRAKNIMKSAKAIESRIEQMEKLEKPKKDRNIDFSIPHGIQLHNKYAIIGRDLNKKYGEKILFEEAQFDIETDEKIALVGKNGSGKTTLLKMILENEKGITKSSKLEIGYLDQLLELLKEEMTVLETVKRKSIYHEKRLRAFLGQMLFNERDIHKKVNVLSGGERVRLALCKLFVSRYNLLILDEPTNFLDVASIEVLEKAMIAYPGTILFTSHDQRFVEKVATKILQVDNKKIQDITNTFY